MTTVTGAVDPALIFPESRGRQIPLYASPETRGGPSQPMKELYLSSGETEAMLRVLKTEDDERANELRGPPTHPEAQAEWDKYSDPSAYIQAEEQKIRDVVDRMYQLYFFTLICVWDTPYVFTWSEGSDQYGQGTKSTYVTSPDGTKRVKVETQAAHSAVLPCLLARPLHSPTSEPKIYLRNAGLGINLNVTVELPIKVNQSDTERDGTHDSSQLRNKLIKDINLVAMRQLTVQEAMSRFDALFTQTVLEKAQKSGQNPLKTQVYEIYRGRAEEINIDDPGTLDEILALSIEESPEDSVLREVVYARRFRLIQTIQKLENLASKHILDANKKVSRSRTLNIGKINWMLRYSLLKQASPSILPRLETFLCTSIHLLEDDANHILTRTRAVKDQKTLENFQKKHRATIQQTLRKLGQIFENEASEILTYRSRLFYGILREYKHWKQKDFIARFKQLYPNISMYPAKISRWGFHARPLKPNYTYKTPVNQRRKPVTENDANRIASTYGVDPGIFLHALC